MESNFMHKNVYMNYVTIALDPSNNYIAYKYKRDKFFYKKREGTNRQRSSNQKIQKYKTLDM